MLIFKVINCFITPVTDGGYVIINVGDSIIIYQNNVWVPSKRGDNKLIKTNLTFEMVKQNIKQYE